MRIIISPAKKMIQRDDLPMDMETPALIGDAEKIMHWMQRLSYSEAKTLWNCNDRIAEENFNRLQTMNLYGNLTPAIVAFEGIQYRYMAPAVFEDTMLDYVQEHLRILSGFYGVLRPMDGVTPYRLEMQARAGVGDAKDLCAFWGRRLYDAVKDDSRLIVNLASREYSACVERYLQPEDTFVTCTFGELSGGRVRQKGTYAKMARGEMVRYMAENQIERPEEMQRFRRLGYEFCADLSTETSYVFVRP